MEIPRIGSKQIEASQDQDQKTTKTTSGSPAGVAGTTDQLETAVKTSNLFGDVLLQAEGIGLNQLIPEQQVDVNIDLLAQDGSGASRKKEDANLRSLVPGGSTTSPGDAHGISDGKQTVLDLLTQMFPGGSTANEALQMIDDLVQGDFSKLSIEGQKGKVLEGIGISDPGSRLPSGNVIDAANSATDPTPTPYGKALIAYDSGTYRIDRGGGFALASDKAETSRNGTMTLTHTETIFLTVMEPPIEAETRTTVTEFKTDNSKTVTETRTEKLTGDVRTKTSTTNSDGSVDETTSTTGTDDKGVTTTTTTTTHTPPPSTKDPGSEGDRPLPVFLQQQIAHDAAQLRAAKGKTGSGDVDPDEQAEPKGGTSTIDPQIHLFELGKLGLLGNPDTTREVGGSGTVGSVPIGNVDGNIDPDDDSTS